MPKILKENKNKVKPLKMLQNFKQKKVKKKKYKRDELNFKTPPPNNNMTIDPNNLMSSQAASFQGF